MSHPDGTLFAKALDYLFGGIFLLCFYGFIAFVILGIVGNLFL